MTGDPNPKPVKETKQRRRSLIPHRRPPATEDEREAMLQFKIKVHALDGRCVVHEFATDCEGDFHAHHVISQQQLRHAGRDDLMWDWRNGATVCDLAHRRHHRAIQRIPMVKLPPRCIAFAAEHGFTDILNRFYTRPS